MARNFSPIYCLNLGTKSWFPDWSGWLPWPRMWCWWCWLVGCAATICSWVDGVTSLSRSMPNYRVTAPSFNGVHIACSGADIIGIRAKQLPGKAAGAFERSKCKNAHCLNCVVPPLLRHLDWILVCAYWKVNYNLQFISLGNADFQRGQRNRNKYKTVIPITWGLGFKICSEFSAFLEKGRIMKVDYN